MSVSDWDTGGYADALAATGVSYVRSQIKMAHITDGPSQTYLIGERSENPDYYLTGTNCDDDQGWSQGYDFDTFRWTYGTPQQDIPGYGGCGVIFGSSHAVSFNMAFCDGSVHSINYNIDATTHARLGNRKDHYAINATMWQ